MTAAATDVVFGRAWKVCPFRKRVLLVLRPRYDSESILEVYANMALLTARVAADRMGIGYSTLKQWIHQGKIRTTQTAGGHHRLSEAEIDRLLARHTPLAKPSSRENKRPTGLIVALSGRNRLRGFVEEVRADGLLGQVRLRIGDQILTAVITSDALDELKLRRGDDALAIIKSTEVMIAREADAPPVPARRRRARR
jgi:molybdopterin-binding protein